MGMRNVLRLLKAALVDGLKIDLASGDSMQVLPLVDDQGKFQFGDGTTDLDVEVFLGSASEKVTFDVGNSKLDIDVPVEIAGALTQIGAVTVGVDDTGHDVTLYGATASANLLWDESADALIFNGGAALLDKRMVVAKASSYPVVLADSGKIFTTTGASRAITFTLPAVATSTGMVVEFYNTVDQNMIVTGPDETILCFNDLTADSIAFQTTGEKIGGGIKAFCDGAKWVCVPFATETQTVTIASA